MKSCPLCAEEIKDDAIRCKHCGGDIAAHEDNLQSQLASQKSQASSKASSDKKKKIGTMMLAVLGVIYGLVVALVIKTNILVYVVLPVISPVMLILAWKVGGWIGRLNQADTIYATQGNLAGARIANYLAPVGTAIVASLITLGMIGVGAITMFSHESAVKPATASVVEPTTVSVVKPATVSVVEPATVSVVEPTTVSVVEPTPVSVAEPAREAAAVPTSFAPSFNCAKASTGSEQLVCSNSDLSALDVKLSQIYQQVMSKSNDINSLKKSQNEWRNTKRDACSDVNCLISAYNERINELSQQASTNSSGAAQQPSQPAGVNQNPNPQEMLKMFGDIINKEQKR